MREGGGLQEGALARQSLTPWWIIIQNNIIDLRSSGFATRKFQMHVGINKIRQPIKYVNENRRHIRDENAHPYLN